MRGLTARGPSPSADVVLLSNIGVPERVWEHGRVHDLSELIGAEVRRVAFDYQVTLLFVAGTPDAERVSAYLQLETPVQY